MYRYKFVFSLPFNILFENFLATSLYVHTTIYRIDTNYIYLNIDVYVPTHVYWPFNSWKQPVY